MKRRLFLTGPMGCGKSTAILTAAKNHLPQFGGFLTRRMRDDQGQALSFYLTSPDGVQKATFLDCTGSKPEVHMEVFCSLGVELLLPRGITGTAPYVLDEIGGIELLCPEFWDALDHVLDSDAPILGVLKGEGPASAMVTRLGLTKEYESAAAALRSRLAKDADTRIYYCTQFDPHALFLAEQWVKEYAHE